jgi:hypothetical protein
MTDERQPPVLGLPAPGLVWRKRKDGWVATWQARTDRVEKGYRPKYIAIWMGVEPTEPEAIDISTRCQHQQYDMLTWGRELPPPEKPAPAGFNGTLHSLIHCYQTDADSPYQKNRYVTRKWRNTMLRRMIALYGDTPLSEIKARVLLAWHKDLAEKVAPSERIGPHRPVSQPVQLRRHPPGRSRLRTALRRPEQNALSRRQAAERERHR